MLDSDGAGCARSLFIAAALLVVGCAGERARPGDPPTVLVKGDGSGDYPTSQATVDSDHPTNDGMVWIPAGCVRLGERRTSWPVHNVYLEGFHIDTREVSNAAYQEFIEAGGYSTEAWWHPVGWAWRIAERITQPAYWDSVNYHGGGVAGNADFPILGVSWWEADAYCRWAGKRLPTEAEWEKAATGGCEVWGNPDSCDAADAASFPWGEGIRDTQANYRYSGDPYENNGHTTPVGFYDGTDHGGYQTEDSPSPYGLYDVVGNVWEWCSTKLKDYPYDPYDGREAPPATYKERWRVRRGGSWRMTTSFVRCGLARDCSNLGRPNRRDRFTGFRCARGRQ